MRFSALLICVLFAANSAIAAPGEAPHPSDFKTYIENEINCGQESARPCWYGELRTILHHVAGDDLQAYFGFLPKLSIIKSSHPNAFALDPETVLISTGLLQKVGSRSELAFILLHEVGHLVLEHPGQKSALLGPSISSKLDKEFEADQYAFATLAEFGIDVSGGSNLLARMQNHPSTNNPTTKATLSLRLSRLKSGLKSK